MASARSLLHHQHRACTRGLQRPCRFSGSARWLYIDSVTVVWPRVDRVRACQARTARVHACEPLSAEEGKSKPSQSYVGHRWMWHRSRVK